MSSADLPTMLRCNSNFSRLCALISLLLTLLATSGPLSSADQNLPIATVAAPIAEMVIPNARRWNQPQAVQITAVDVAIKIREQTATTTLLIRLHNPGSTDQQAELLLPVPADAVYRGFDFEGSAQEPTAKLLTTEEARRIYDGIVARRRDPALLEFVGCSLIRSSVFPVTAGGNQTIKITYEQLLTASNNRVDYLLPRSETLATDIPWNITVDLQSTTPIATVYSPSHTLTITRATAGKLQLKLAAEAQKQPGPFQLSYLKAGDGVNAALFAYPDPTVGGGYFLLLAGLPVRAADAIHASPQDREVTLVLDCSGSMKGEKLAQVQAAALQVIRGLEHGEAFNLISYNNTVECFRDRPVLKDATTLAAAEKFIADLTATGGTNIYDALNEALRQPTVAGALPMILFLTDGLATIGKTGETDIRDLALKHNPHNRRVFTIGVGAQLNTPLLEKIAAETRATTAFVLAHENVTTKIGTVFDRLRGPVFASPTLTARADEHGHGRVQELFPAPLPDLFEGDQLVVLGKYTGDAPLKFTIQGDFLGADRRFEFTFDLAQASTQHAFVPRLWAARKIEALIDIIRQSGADPRNPAVIARSPELKAVVDQIVQLSTQFGILTEYTAFLALEGTDLSHSAALNQAAQDNLQQRAIGARSGAASVNQEMNKQAWKAQATLNRTNEYYDAQLNRVEVGGVQQVNDRTFYRRDGRWIDSRLATAPATAAPAREIAFGSPDYSALVTQLAAENRQAVLAQSGDVLLLNHGEAVLVKAAQ